MGRLTGLLLLAGALAPALAAAASPTIAIGSSASATRVGQGFAGTAVLSGAANPTGTITFKLYGPSDPTCSSTPVFAPAPVQVVGGVTSYQSGGYTPSTIGTYRWRASYSGDANNVAPGTTACDDPAAAVVVSPPVANPTIVTHASGTVTAGGQITATATIANGNSPAGRITFMVFGPDDTNCATPLATSVTPVSGNGDYGSAAYTAAVAGTYRWVAAYSGDADNLAPSPTACADPAAAVAVSAPVSVADSGGINLTVVAPGGNASASANAKSSAASGKDGAGGPGGSLGFTPVLSRILTGRSLFVRLKVPSNGQARISYVAMKGSKILSSKRTSVIFIKNNQTSLTFHLPKKALTATTIRISARYAGITVARTIVRKHH
ncbi:MAG TPA: hypothetical protein VHZ75_11350 [Solirubrobacteraceae bacterium]|nr:hypothetical protein [Solirubrobacteraceae bacterium]